MSKIILIAFILFTSCASAKKNWGPWQRAGVEESEMVWHFCQEDLDGSEYHHKGICYQAQECRYRKTIFGNTRSECRNKTLFCAWGDIQCMLENNLFPRRISHKGE